MVGGEVHIHADDTHQDIFCVLDITHYYVFHLTFERFAFLLFNILALFLKALSHLNV